jgi:M6 family metalloprotease-like protein
MRYTKLLAITLSFLFLHSPLQAVRHIQEGVYPNAKKDMIGRPSQTEIRRFGSRRNAIIGGVIGTKNVAVIVVQFPAGNAALISGSRTIQNLAGINTNFADMASYFSEVSNSNITLNFRFFGPSAGNNVSAVAAGAYTMTQPMEYYGCGDEGVGCSGVTVPFPANPRQANGDILIRDALALARADYAGLPNGTAFDAILVVHAGNGNETTTSTNGDIWSIFYSEAGSTIGAAASGFDEGMVIPETEALGIVPFGVWCHEFGHELGLPDLYNTNGGSSVVGRWDLMDYGPYLGSGANPAHMGAWSKYALGWSTPTVVSSQGSATLGYAAIVPNAMLKINVPNGLAQEYFLVEYRNRSSGATYDQAIPGDGLIVWHVDGEITSTRGIGASGSSQNSVNTGIPHYGVSVVTADGTTISNASLGNAANAFTNGQIFISPQSDNFAREPSGVSIVNISGVGTALVSMDVASLGVSGGQRISKIINFPNPAGKGYPHPSGEGHSTIQFQLTRPAQDYSINIYTLSADLVRKVNKSDITLNILKSADLKWVYEYDWNLTNGNSAHVAPGVYLYMIRADGETKSGKAVVIR